MTGFDDFLTRVNDTWGEKPRDPDAPAQWEFKTVHTDVKKKAKVMQRMSRDGWEYVEETKNPMFALRPPLALRFRRQS
jgi:hypothetical protein